MDKIKVEQMDSDEVEKKGISSWGIWEKEPSKFDWEYTSEEQCYIINGKAEIESKTIGEYVMNQLKETDHVAYIRFASVYRSFADVSSFEEEIKNLSKQRNGAGEIKK